MEQVIISPATEQPETTPNTTWLSTNNRHLVLPPRGVGWAQALDRWLHHASLKRLSRDTWIRYRLDLTSYLSADDSPATLTPITAELIDALSRGPWGQQPQVRTANHLWCHGLRGGYVWLQNEKPLCMQWLFSHQDNPLLQELPQWSGMYPPLPADWGQVENLLNLPAGMRYPGGAAGPFAHAMHRLAAKQGMRWLITHIHERNTAAHRWAKRTGWSAYGHIRRYQLDLPLLRNKFLYLHDTTSVDIEVSS